MPTTRIVTNRIARFGPILTMDAPVVVPVGRIRTASPLGTTRFARSEPVSVVEQVVGPLARDHLTATWDVLETDAELRSGFGRAGWLWRTGQSGVPVREPRPVAALTRVSGSTTIESAGIDGLHPSTGEGEIQVSVFSDTLDQTVDQALDQARDLGRRIALVLTTADIVWEDGRSIGVWWINADDEPELEDDPGPQGQAILNQLVRVRYMSEGVPR